MQFNSTDRIYDIYGEHSDYFLFENRKNEKNKITEKNGKKQIQSKVNRAKLFSSFDALKGFKEKIQEKERIIVDRPDLMEDALYELDWKFQLLSVGKMIEIIYFDRNCFVKRTGMITKLDLREGNNEKIVKVVEKEIKAKNIVSIEFL